MVLRPVGDQPASVYWVRRLMVLVVVLVVVGLAWWLWPSGDEAEPAAGEPAATATPTTSVTPSETATPTASRTKQPESDLAPECADSAIEVTVQTDAETYPPGQRPSFTFEVTNVSDETCSRDVGQIANELRVTSGGAQVWSSDDCNPGGVADLTDLDPEDRFVQTVSWDRVSSSEGCPTGQAEAAPGTYQVVARNGDVLSEPAVFVLG